MKKKTNMQKPLYVEYTVQVKKTVHKATPPVKVNEETYELLKSGKCTVVKDYRGEVISLRVGRICEVVNGVKECEKLKVRITQSMPTAAVRIEGDSNIKEAKVRHTSLGIYLRNEGKELAK